MRAEWDNYRLYIASSDRGYTGYIYRDGEMIFSDSYDTFGAGQKDMERRVEEERYRLFAPLPPVQQGVGLVEAGYVLDQADAAAINYLVNLYSDIPEAEGNS